MLYKGFDNCLPLFPLDYLAADSVPPRIIQTGAWNVQYSAHFAYGVFPQPLRRKRYSFLCRSAKYAVAFFMILDLSESDVRLLVIFMREIKGKTAGSGADTSTVIAEVIRRLGGNIDTP